MYIVYVYTYTLIHAAYIILHDPPCSPMNGLSFALVLTAGSRRLWLAGRPHMACAGSTIAPLHSLGPGSYY